LPLFSLLFAFGACSSDPTAPATGAGGSGTSSGGSSSAGDPNAVIGSFSLRLVAPVPATADTDAVAGTTSLDGLLWSGPQLPQVTLKQTMQEGDCVLLVPSAPFCNPTCGATATCVAINTTSNAGACQAMPVARGAGSVTFTGLTTTGMGPVVLEPDPISHFYAAGPEANLVFPPFQEGTDLGLAAAGGDLPAFTAKSKGIHLLEVTANGPIKIDKDQPMPLRWTKSGQPGTSGIEVKLDISHHGGSKGQINCDTADSGAIDIPAKLITALIGLGVAGDPTVSIIRKAVGYAQLPTGRIAFLVTSSNEQPVVVAGFISCNEKEPCPAGKTCGVDRLCR
jgi:hypothetical protein